MFNFVSKENRDGEHGFSFNLEKVRSTFSFRTQECLSRYMILELYSELFITKLLGNFKVGGSYRTIQEL